MNTVEINNSNFSVKYFGYVAGPLTVISVLLPLIALRLMSAFITIFSTVFRHEYLSYAVLLLSLAGNLQFGIGYELNTSWNDSITTFLNVITIYLPLFLFWVHLWRYFNIVVMKIKGYQRRRLDEGFYVSALPSISHVVHRREVTHFAIILIIVGIYTVGLAYDVWAGVAAILVYFIYEGATWYWDAKHTPSLRY